MAKTTAMPTPPAPEGRTALLRHACGDRVRLAILGPAPDVEEATRLLASVEAVAGVRAASFRPATGSLVIRHDLPLEALRQGLGGAGLKVLGAPAPGDAPIDPIADAAERLAWAQGAATRATDGRIDVWSLAFAGLVAAALVQLARGRIAGPAITLLGQAATLAAARPPRFPRR